MSELILTENAVDRSTPASGKVTMYPKSDGMYIRKSTGAIAKISQDFSTNTIRVSATGEYQSVQDVIDYLETLSTTNAVRVVFDGGHYLIEDTVVINLTMPISFDGMSNSGVTLCAGTGLTNKNMFELYSDADFFGFNFDGSHHNANWTTGTNADFIKLFGGANTECTYFTSVGGKNFFNLVEDGCSAFALNFVSEGGTTFATMNSSGTCYIDCEVGNIIDFATAFDFINATDSDNYFSGIRFIPSSLTAKCFNYDGTNYAYSNFTIAGCEHNNIGDFAVGFDFTIARDADIEALNNVGYENKLPHGKIWVDGSTASQSINSNTWTKLNLTLTDSYLTKWGASGNKITYLSGHIRDCMAWVSGNLLTTTLPTTIEIGIVKNRDTNTVYGKMQIYADINNRAFAFSLNAYLEEVAKDDYYELYIKATANETIIIQDVHWIFSAI